MIHQDRIGLRCVRARRSARRDAKSDAVTSVERRNEAGARPHATLRAGGFCVAGSSKGSTVVPATGLRPSPARAAKSLRRRRFYPGGSCSKHEALLGVPAPAGQMRQSPVGDRLTRRPASPRYRAQIPKPLQSALSSSSARLPPCDLGPDRPAKAKNAVLRHPTPPKGGPRTAQVCPAAHRDAPPLCRTRHKHARYILPMISRRHVDPQIWRADALHRLGTIRDPDARATRQPRGDRGG